MSKNFELLTHVEGDRELFQERKAQLAVARREPLRLGDVAREELARLVQRIFLLPRDRVAHGAVAFCGIEHGDGTSWICAQVARVVAAQGPIRNFLESGPGGNLWVLPAGLDVDPRLLLTSERFRERVAELRAEFDYLIFDAPPAARSNDAAVLGGLLDGVVLVVGAHSTRRETARKAKENLEKGHVRLLGTVLNGRTFPIPNALYRRL
jgi:hypothetical protein